MKWLITAGILFVLAKEDVKDRQVSVFWIAILIGVGLIDLILHRDPTPLYGMLPGAIFLGLSILAKPHVGRGDGLCLIALGILCGLQRMLAILFYSGICVGIVATVLLITGKGDKNTSLPFLLYLFIGYIGDFLIRLIGVLV